MKLIIKSFHLFILGIAFLSSLDTVFAFDAPSHDGYVTDMANVLSPSEESALTESITRIESETTSEIALLTINTTGEYEIADYTFEVGNAWGVGKSDNDNGLMIVIAVKDRDWFMASGYGLEGVLPDARLKHIGERYFPDNFRKGDYAAGLRLVLSDVEKFLKEDPTIISEYQGLKSTNIISSYNNFIFISILLLIVYLYSKIEEKKWPNFIIAIAFAIYVYFSLFSIIQALIAGLFGYFGIIGRGGRGGGGWSSGGGFGGGSFGGGGAGGSW